MIRGGLEYGLGIYITGIDEGSLARKYGLKVLYLYSTLEIYTFINFKKHLGNSGWRRNSGGERTEAERSYPRRRGRGLAIFPEDQAGGQGRQQGAAQQQRRQRQQRQQQQHRHSAGILTHKKRFEERVKK